MTKIKIGIIDDDLGDRKNLERLLNKSKLDVDVSIIESLNSISSDAVNEYDILLVDYQMPGENGIQLVPKILKSDPYLGIIMITGWGNDAVAREAFKVGVTDYLAKKELTVDILKKSIEYALEKSRYRKKLYKQHVALESFARILVHDLTIPTGNISSLLELLMENLEKGDIESAKELASEAKGVATGLIDLIRTLREYNSIEGSSRISFKDASLELLCAKAVEYLGSFLKEKGAKVLIDKLPSAVVNEAQFIQLIQNLIQNGVKYCDKENPEVRISCENRNCQNCVAVKDNGIGIEKKYHRSIFNQFTRLHAASDKKYDGTGLGLATCNTIVERHKGEIWCESEPGEGTTFYFTLNAEPTNKYE